ncbi:MAG: hypothetical protein WAQ52_07800 [Terriglobales bacterium]
MSTPPKQKTATAVVAPEKPVNPGRHEAQCSICKHPNREEIEREFVGWGSPAKIAKTYSLQRDTVYRHARACDLFEPRGRNVKAALGRMIERVCDVPINASAIVAAIGAYSKINANGQWVERRETVDMVELFKRMTRNELRGYVDRGELPLWFTSVVGHTATDSQGSEDEH